MNSKKEPSKPKGLLSIFGVSESSDSEQETEQEQTAKVPEIEKKGGKTRRVDKYGSRRKVWNGTAERTKGGLRKEDLVRNNRGRIVSAKRHTTMKNRHSTA
jgi:hypothetical protein